MSDMEKKQKTPKEKRRNMERRKEKSRDAARCRRSKETEIFTDLSSMLPLTKSDSVSHLDKASIIRIAISYLKIRTIVQSIPMTLYEKNERVESCDTDPLFQNALEGFLLVTTTDGDIVFISENVQRYLGLSQIDLLGQSIYDLSHPCDHVEIKDMLSTKDPNTQKSYFLRMKCTLTNKGRNVNIKSASYKVIQYTGRFVENHNKLNFDDLKKEHSDGKEDSDESFKSEEDSSLNAAKVYGVSSFHFVAVGEPIYHPVNIEIPLGRNTFLTKHALDMKFTYADERISEFFAYNPDDLLEKSIFDYHHAEDSVALRECFKNLFQKGQSQTERYRFLAFGGGYAWVLTQATVIYSNVSQKPTSIVCVNFVISGVENRHEIYSLCQIEKDCNTPNTTTARNRCNDELIEDLDLRDGYVYENSPQRQFEKLTIDTSSSSEATAVEKVVHCSNSTYQLADIPVPRNKFIGSGDSASVNTEASPLKPRQLQPLSANDFLVSCSSSTSDSANTDSRPSTLDADWLVTTNSEGVLSSEFSNATNDLKPIEIEIKLPEKSNKTKFVERVCATSKIFSSVIETPKPATVGVFVPFTEDMNKGFLGFADDETGLTMLKEDPEDLTHLAPTAGDVCVPLDETPIEYVLPDMLDDIILSDCKLLSSDNADSYLSTSPNSFFSYRNDLETSSRPLSPILPQNDDCGIQSLCSEDSPLHNSGVDPFLDFEGLMHSSDEIDNLSVKNSLIPLTLDPDPILPFVTNDFMWGSSSEESAWSSVSNSPTSNGSSSPCLDHNSSLAKLLTAGSTPSYDGGGADIGEDGGVNGNRQRLTGESTNKKSVNQNDDRVNVNRSCSNVVSACDGKTMIPHHRSSGVGFNSRLEGNKRRYSNNNCSPRMTTSTITTAPLVRNTTVDESTHAAQQAWKRDLNNRGEDKRKNCVYNAAEVAVGNKRSLSENSGRTNVCKRSKQTTKAIFISAAAANGSSGAFGKRMHNPTAMAQAVAAAKQTNSVLMNLLVSGCDLNAGYDEDRDKSKRMMSREQETDGDIKLIEDAVTNGYFSEMNAETWARIKTKFFNPKDLTKLPSILGLLDTDCDVNIPIDTNDSSLNYNYLSTTGYTFNR